jgi:hypothetical protein
MSTVRSFLLISFALTLTCAVRGELVRGDLLNGEDP